jgi:hypothetical protein
MDKSVLNETLDYLNVNMRFMRDKKLATSVSDLKKAFMCVATQECIERQPRKPRALIQEFAQAGQTPTQTALIAIAYFNRNADDNVNASDVRFWITAALTAGADYKRVLSKAENSNVKDTVEKAKLVAAIKGWGFRHGKETAHAVADGPTGGTTQG